MIVNTGHIFVNNPHINDNQMLIPKMENERNLTTNSPQVNAN